MIKPGFIHKGLREISRMEINMVVGNLHINNSQVVIIKIIKMVNTTTTKIFINLTNIRISNIVDILDLMVGKIKNIEKISWMIFSKSIKEIVHNMDLTKICIKIIKKISDNTLSNLKEGRIKFVKHTKLNKWENNNNGEIINKNKWEIFRKKSYKKLVDLKKGLIKMCKVLLKLVIFSKTLWKVL